MAGPPPYDPAAGAAPDVPTGPLAQAGMDSDAADEAQRKFLNPIELTEDELSNLWKDVGRARERIKKQERAWDILLKEYLPIVEATNVAEILKVNVHFRNVHTKIGQLSFRAPDIQCIPKGPLNSPMLDPLNPNPQQPLTPDQITTRKQAALNYTLGPDAINASRLMDECAFDILAWAGIAVTKIGYTQTTKSVTRPKQQPAPTPPPMPGSILRLATPPAQMVPVIGPDGQPVMETVDVPIHSEIYWRRISPKKYLCNDDLHSTRYDDEATWQGHDFFMEQDQAVRGFALHESEQALTAEDDRIFKHPNDAAVGKRTLVKGVELWRKAAVFRPGDQPHPQALDHIVLIDGIKHRTVVCRPSPDQEFTETGELTPDSMVGFPIHVFTIRDLADSPFPPADSAFVNAQAKELNTYRRQTVQLRDRAIGKQLVDSGAFEDTELDQLKYGEVGETIMVKSGALQGGAERLVANTAQPESTPDDWRGQEIIKQDMQETVGISGPQVGSPEETVRSATETAQVATSAAGRIEKEQRRFVDCYLAGARKVDALLARYTTGTQYVSILGDNGARQLLAWNKQMIRGDYAYDILPDSSYRLDAAQLLRVLLSAYNLFAKDPVFNRVPLMRKIMPLLGIDPAQVILTPEQIHAQSQPQHGGKADVISQHEGRQTGNRENSPQGGNTPSRMR